MDAKRDILIIPRHLVSLRFVELPSTDDAEIKNMAEFQALKELPYAKEDLIVSYRKLGPCKKGFSLIMLAVAKREIIEEMLSAGKGKPEGIILGTELLYLSLIKKGLINPANVTLVINVNKDYSEVLVIDKKPVFSRGFMNKDGLSEEINRSIAAYKRDKNNQDIDKTIVTYSADADIEAIKAFLKDSFRAPVNFLEYNYDPEGIDLPLEINLLPAQYIDRKTSADQRKEMLWTYFFIVIAIAAAMSTFVFKVHKKNKALALLTERMDATQAETGMLASMLKKTEILKSHKEDGILIINILKESYNLIPSDISLLSLDYDGKSTVSYKGAAKEMAGVFNFVKVLEKSKYFKKVEIINAAKKEIQGQETADFNIACQINAVK